MAIGFELPMMIGDRGSRVAWWMVMDWLGSWVGGRLWCGCGGCLTDTIAKMDGGKNSEMAGSTSCKLGNWMS